MSSKDLLDEEARRQREEKAKKAASASSSLKERIARNKAEAERKKKEKEDAAKAKKEAEAVAAKARADKIKASVLQGKRMSQAKLEIGKAEKEAAKKAKLEKQEKAKAEAKALVQRTKEEAARKKAAEEEAKAEKSRLEAEAKAKELEERKKRREAELEAARDAKAKAEEEEKARLAELQAYEERKRKFKQEKRLKELAEKKATEEAEEKAKREEAEAKLKALEEEARIARQKHAEEVRKQQEAERDLEEEEKEKLEAQRAKEFEEEQKRRQKEVEDMTREEEERRKEQEQKMKELGLASHVVNRCGLFSNYGEEPGLEIWVLGDQQISKIAKMKHGLRGLIGEAHGTFHTGKAYVILQTAVSGGRSHYHIHTWVGNDCPDNMREQLEERLGELELGLALEDVVAIIRDEQEKESDRLREYFENPIEYVQAVTLRQTEGPNFLDKVLYQIKGRNNVRVRRVDCLASSLNSGDVFVLEDSHAIFQWNGRKSNKMERGKALDFGVQRRIERNARVRVVIVDEGKDEHENKKFWAALTLDRNADGEFVRPGKDGGKDEVCGATPNVERVPVTHQDEGGDDIKHEVNYLAAHSLIKVAQAEGEAEATITDVELDSARGPDVSMLDERFCFIVDAETEIFYWIGNVTSDECRKAAEDKANELAADKSRAPCTAVTRVRQQTEPYLFKEKFSGSWGEYADYDFSERITGNVADLKQEDINIDEMHHPEKYAIAREDERLPVPNYDPKIDSDFSVWVVTDNDKFEVADEQFGIFHEANCYILMYTLKLGVDRNGHDKTRHILYFWQGRHSSREDRGLSALLASEDAKKLRFCQVRRVVQNREPEHFLSHFTSRGFVVLRGNRKDASAELQAGNLLPPANHLYHVRGSDAISVPAIEVESLSAAALNSNDSFLLTHATGSFVWKGKRANAFTVEAAKVISGLYLGSHELVKEGEEPKAFWKEIGGKKDYCTDSDVSVTPSLFTCSNAIGIFRVHRLEEWSQEDLHSRECAILDATSRVFVWVGGDANEECSKMAMETAQKFVDFEAEDTKKRSECPVVREEAGSESIAFQAVFHTWDLTLAEAGKDGYNAKLRALKKAQAAKK